MRRKEREVTSQKEIQDIIEQCKTCHLAMVEEGRPYVVPISFGYEMEGAVLTLYFHCAKVGRKMDILQKNNQVCFDMCSEGEPVFAKDTPCNSGYYYSSLIGNGAVEFVTDTAEKCHALSLLMERQADLHIAFTDKQAENVTVFKIVTEDYTGKKKPNPA